MAVSGHKVGADFCRVLGLDPKQVKGITIIVEPCEIVVAKVELMMNEEQVAALEGPLTADPPKIIYVPQKF